MKIKPALYYSHSLLQTVVEHGDTVIDATVGNGNDTEFLANLVGPNGMVYGFDIQELAIEHTNKRLAEQNLLNQVKLYHRGHEQINNTLPPEQLIRAATFNLGYLPGSDHKKITTANTTIPAIKACLARLQPNGIITIVLYYGHPGGKNEKELVIQFSEQLDQKEFTVLKYQFINQVNNPPILIAIQKR